MPLHYPTVHKPGKSMHIEKGPTAAVRNRQVVNLGQMTSLARFGVATAKATVRLQNVYRLSLYEFTKPPTMPLHLPCGNRYFGMRTQVCERSGIVLVQRLLKPCNVAVFDRTAKKFGLHRVEQIIGVDHEVDVAAHSVANGANANGILAPTFLVHSDDEFHCGETPRDLQLCSFGQLFAIVLRKPEGHIGRYRSSGISKQACDRSVRGLTLNVPESDV